MFERHQTGSHAHQLKGTSAQIHVQTQLLLS